MVKDKTGGERQSRLRLARSKWLKEHGFNSAEGLLGALMRGECSLQWVSVPTKRASDGLESPAKNQPSTAEVKSPAKKRKSTSRA